MANIIGNAVYKCDGSSENGAYVTHDASVSGASLATLKVTTTFKFYISEQAKTDGYEPFCAIKDQVDREVLGKAILDITEEQANTFDKTVLQTIVTEYLETIYTDVTPV
jgi:ABC-type transporter MlaC component